MDELRESWPDPDRRHYALLRLGRRIAAEKRPGIYEAEPVPGELSATERAAIQAASHGLNADEAAEVLGLTFESLKHAQKYARRKLAAKNTTHAVAIALRRGLIQ